MKIFMENVATQFSTLTKAASDLTKAAADQEKIAKEQSNTLKDYKKTFERIFDQIGDSLLKSQDFRNR